MASKELQVEWNEVSTHSRPEAAGLHLHGVRRADRCFNSQPPGGGWAGMNVYESRAKMRVSTHSRPEAAGATWPAPSRAW